jgi:hypothetical protein
MVTAGRETAAPARGTAAAQGVASQEVPMPVTRVTLAATLFLSIIAAAAACGGEKTKLGANVECSVPTPAAVECEVKQTEGKKEIEVCWDFTIECNNGVTMSAPNTCQKVKDGGTEKVSIPRSAIENADSCGGKGMPTAKVANLTIDGKKAQ